MEAVINGCPAFAISQEYYEHPDFALAAVAATIVARNILEHGLSRGELINVNVPAVTIEECDGHRGHPAGPAGLPGRARRAARPARHALLLDRRPASVRPGRSRAPTSTRSINRRIAVTPIHLDLTGRSLLRRLKTWTWTLPQDATEATETTEASEASDG